VAEKERHNAQLSARLPARQELVLGAGEKKDIGSAGVRMTYKLLDVCCGMWGWSKQFARRGNWECIGIDLLEHHSAPEHCKLVRMNLLALNVEMLKKWEIDFGISSTPCEEFTCISMPNFQPDAPFPALGIKLFKHIEGVFLESGIPFVMENVRAAQEFVGESVANCGPFHLWGNAVPPILPQGIKKGLNMKRARDKNGKRIYAAAADKLWSTKRKTLVATIPPELANCVADYAERLLEQRAHDRSLI